MASFGFSLEQVSFPSADISLHSSLDSLASVVDPNVDFVIKNDHSEMEATKDITKEWKQMDKMSNHPLSKKISENKSASFEVGSPNGILSKDLPPISQHPSYPTISLEVAQYINKNNPDLCQEAERYFTSQTNTSFECTHSPVINNISPTSPLHSMSVTTEALALQQSVIGNFGVKPVSADIVAQVVANTKRKLEKESLEKSSSTVPPSTYINNTKTNTGAENSDTVSLQTIPNYPPRNVSSLNSVNFSNFNNTLKSQTPSPNKSFRKTVKSNDNDLPKVHVRSLKSSKHSTFENNFENSIEYETESNLSERFDAESFCSEAFENESNFSEFSVFEEEFSARKILESPRSSSSTMDENEKLKKLILLENSRVLETNKKTDKSTETYDTHNFELLREKAKLEGRLESLIAERNDLMVQRDKFSVLATTNEAQLQTLQAQLQSTATEKTNALQLANMKSKEEKNWDNVIKEYQSIVETKNAEVKALKEDWSESERAGMQTRINLEELKVDMESKDAAIGGLKKKIAELHVEVQLLLQGKIQQENEVKNVRLEMDTLQKSREWFQGQLHSEQEDRNKLQQQLISLQKDLSVMSNSTEKVSSERNQLKQELIYVQQRAVAEKEVLMKRLETIEADMKERESLFDDIQKDKGSAEAVMLDRIRKLEEEKMHLMNVSFTVSNQEHELNALRSDCAGKEKLIHSLGKETAELTKQVAILQKSSTNKDLSIQQLSQQMKDLKTKLACSEKEGQRAEELITALKEERTAADVALASANQEKRDMNQTLMVLGENLNKLQYNFKHMQTNLVTQTSRAEQLLKEKKLMEEIIRKMEENLTTSRKEFEQQVLVDKQNKNVMFDDLRKKKNDVENVLNVYQKDLMNYQQIAENLNKQKVELVNELSSLKKILFEKDNKIESIIAENEDLKKNLLVPQALNVNVENSLKENNAAENQTNGLLGSLPSDVELKQISKKTILYKKLKDKIKECESLREKLKAKDDSSKNKSNLEYSNECQRNCHHLDVDNNISELQLQLEHHKQLLEEQSTKLKNAEETIIELEKEQGKAIGLYDQCNLLKQCMAELETKSSEKDFKLAQLNCLIDELKKNVSDQDSTFKMKMSNLETDLTKEQAVVKSLRHQVFQEKRSNMHLQRDFASLKTALEQANQIADSKKQEICSLQNEMSLKIQAELKHRTEIEHFQTEICLQRNIVEKLNKELEEMKARDPALAEQIKAISWRLKEKTNEVISLQEKISLIEESHIKETESLRKNMQGTELLLEKLKTELEDTRKEKFNYQSKVIELRKALKSKLAELEAKGILRVENKASSDGPIIHLNLPSPEVSIDEAYVNDLLQKSMQLSESRPLNNLQECLNSLKEEMTQLQKKIIENCEAT